MTSLLEKYKWFRYGIVKPHVNEKLQRFFKTDITEEQIVFLNEYLEEQNTGFLISLLLYAILFFVLGVTIAYSFLKFKYMLGLPLF